jgi:hypothetical protein
MVYCQIWLNPPWNDSHVFYIFLRMNANSAKNKKNTAASKNSNNIVRGLLVLVNWMVLGTTRSPKLPSKPLIHPSCPAARSVVDLQVHHLREFSRLVHPHSLLVHIASALYCLSRTSEAETTQINFSFPRKRFASSLPGFHRVRRTHRSCISSLSLSLFRAFM